MKAAPSDPVTAIATTVLYEGYILWPYRRTALKNRQRWTLGGVYPESWHRHGHDDDRCIARTECLIEASDAFDLDVTVRFLHVVDRRLTRTDSSGLEQFVDEILVGNERYVAWQEAVERVMPRSLADLSTSRRTRARFPISINGGLEREPLLTEATRTVAAIVRSWEPLTGHVDVRVERAADGIARVCVEVANHTPTAVATRDDVLRSTFVAAHVVLRASDAAFVSAIDPPAALADIAATCTNIGLWPVLVGVEPDRSTVLACPIILYDYPRVAPESAGDFFDAAEIDQLLVLSVLSMTEEEQARMRETDPRAREILERCRGMSADDMLRLHGVTRELRDSQVSS